jgi:hypothetical protein
MFESLMIFILIIYENTFLYGCVANSLFPVEGKPWQLGEARRLLHRP